VWRVAALLRGEHSIIRSQVSSERLIHLVAGLEPGDQASLYLASDGRGDVAIELHLRTRLPDMGDLISWVGEGSVEWETMSAPHDRIDMFDLPALGYVAEILPAVCAPHTPGWLELPEFLELDAGTRHPQPVEDLWPVATAHDGMDLLAALRSVEAQIRVHMTPASPVEAQYVAARMKDSTQAAHAELRTEYIGTPIRVRCFAGQPTPWMSPRLRATLAANAIGLQTVPLDLGQPDVLAAWAGDYETLTAAVQPLGVARCLVRIPTSPATAQVVGLATKFADPEPVPVSGTDWPTDGLRLGTAVNAAGRAVEVRIGLSDLTLHTQILGVPGSGKSTLLAALVHEAASAGIGVTVLEGHGSLVTRIVDELPLPAIDRTLIVRSGDSDHPVPLNPIGPDPTGTMQQVFLEVLYDLFDRDRTGIIGPRFERVYGQMMEALRLLIGDRATVSAIPHLLDSTNTLKKLVAVLTPLNPELARSIRTELAENRSNELGDLLAWITAKFQRFLSNPLMRQITGTGADTVDLTKLIDARELLLVDLASVTLGAGNSVLLGEMWLAKHWAAMTQRSDPSTPHLLIIDEAHLFGAGLLPRLIAEGRKFGIAIVLAHQHLEQLAPALREAAVAATNNIITFRSGPREAITSTTRLGVWPGESLTRLPRLSAAATLSNGYQQSDPFSLMVDHNARIGPGDNQRLRCLAEDRSRQLLVNPHRGTEIITSSYLQAVIDQKMPRPEPSFLDTWRAARDREATQTSRTTDLPTS